MDERAKYKKKIIILVSIAAVVVAGVITAVAILLIKKGNETKYFETTKKAESYIREGNYESAIKEYKAALDLRDDDPKVYQKLSVLYEMSGNPTEAKNYILKGYQVTQDPELQELIYKFNSDGVTGLKFEEGSDTLVTMDTVTIPGSDKDKEKAKLETLEFVRSVSEMVLEKKYADYVATYGTPSFSTEGDYTKASFGAVDVLYPASVKDDATAKAYKGDAVAVRYKDITSLFKNFNGTATYADVSKALEGEPEIKYDDAAGRNYLSITYLGCLIKIECDKDGNVVKKDAWNQISALDASIPDASDGQDPEGDAEEKVAGGSFSGKIKDASTGKGLKSVHMTFRWGKNKKNGEATFECDTDRNGNYYAAMKEGNYCVQISKKGYVDLYENVKIIRGVKKTGQDFIISGKLASGQIRIVLTWDAAPRDLDSYLIGRTDSGVNVDVNFRSKICEKDGKKVAELDVDDMDGHGPETTTIYTEGSYTFTVKDFGNTSSMAGTGAKVVIYLPDNTTKTVEIPASLRDPNEWQVLKIDHGKVKIINK